MCLTRNAADVLANQVAAIAVEYGEIERAKIREILETHFGFYRVAGLSLMMYAGRWRNTG